MGVPIKLWLCGVYLLVALLCCSQIVVVSARRVFDLRMHVADVSTVVPVSTTASAVPQFSMSFASFTPSSVVTRVSAQMSNGVSTAAVSTVATSFAVSSFSRTMFSLSMVEFGSVQPTIRPTAPPTHPPTTSPTAAPTASPTVPPTVAPTVPPTQAPTEAVVSFRVSTVSVSMAFASVITAPSPVPSIAPTIASTFAPSDGPTAAPTASPTFEPTVVPSGIPTAAPTLLPTAEPSAAPTLNPTLAPTAGATGAPTPAPSTSKPTRMPLSPPTTNPEPTIAPSMFPTVAGVVDQQVTIPITTTMSGISVAQFDSSAQDAFKNSIAQFIQGVSADDVIITAIVATNSSRRLLDGESESYALLTYLRGSHPALSTTNSSRQLLEYFGVFGRSGVRIQASGISVEWALIVAMTSLGFSSPSDLFDSVSSQLSDTTSLVAVLANNNPVFASVTVSQDIQSFTATTFAPTLSPTAVPSSPTAQSSHSNRLTARKLEWAIILVSVVVGCAMIGLGVYWYRQNRYDKTHKDLGRPEKVAVEAYEPSEPSGHAVNDDAFAIIVSEDPQQDGFLLGDFEKPASRVPALLQLPQDQNTEPVDLVKSVESVGHIASNESDMSVVDDKQVLVLPTEVPILLGDDLDDAAVSKAVADMIESMVRYVETNNVVPEPATKLVPQPIEDEKPFAFPPQFVRAVPKYPGRSPRASLYAQAGVIGPDEGELAQTIAQHGSVRAYLAAQGNTSVAPQQSSTPDFDMHHTYSHRNFDTEMSLQHTNSYSRFYRTNSSNNNNSLAKYDLAEDELAFDSASLSVPAPKSPTRASADEDMFRPPAMPAPPGVPPPPGMRAAAMSTRNNSNSLSGGSSGASSQRNTASNAQPAQPEPSPASSSSVLDTMVSAVSFIPSLPSLFGSAPAAPEQPAPSSTDNAYPNDNNHHDIVAHL
jgi:hypothetical protein